MANPIQLLILGLGDRGSIYAHYALRHPEQFTIVGVADVNKSRREALARACDLPASAVFDSWEGALATPKLADFAVIALPDQAHFAAAMQALDEGYDLFLEKPIACTLDECLVIEARVKSLKRRVILGYVLRYSDYYSHLKSILDTPETGDIISINHIEGMGYMQAAHSFVRGNWAQSAYSSDTLLQKCSHDFDQIVWWLGRSCKAVSSFGSLKFFKPANRPVGAADRCLHCPGAIEQGCPFSAKKLYQQRSTFHYALLDHTEQGIEQELATGRYGRCVYACDNDAIDNQIVNMLFEDNITVTLAMESLTYNQQRTTRVFCTHCEIIGDGTTWQVKYFNTRQTTCWDSLEENLSRTPLTARHGGGDAGVMAELFRAYHHDTIEQWIRRFHLAMESHKIAFAAIQSMQQGGELVLVHP